MTATRLLAAPRRVRWGLVFMWMGVIFAMSARSDSGEQSGFLSQLVFQVVGVVPEGHALENFEYALRKASHFTEYALLALLLAWALPLTWRARLLWAWIGATLYAGSDELHQAFVPNRGPAVTDVMIDSAGAAFALSLLMAARARFRRPR